MHFAESTFVVLVNPSEIPGQWVAHCLNLDVVTQGDSVQHAFAMAEEAVRLVIEDDLSHGLDPLERPKAPEDKWQMASTVLKSGRPLPSIEDPSRIAGAVGYLSVVVPVGALPEHARPTPPEVRAIPPAWQIASLLDLRNARNLPRAS